MKLELSPSRASVLPLHERREPGADRELGRLVSLNGTDGIIACGITPNEAGEHWSVGHLITIVHGNSRLIGVVCELSTANRLWSDSDANTVYVKIELSGEIVDDEFGRAGVLPRHSFLSRARRRRAPHPRRRSQGDLQFSRRPRRRNRPPDPERIDSRLGQHRRTRQSALRGDRIDRRRQDHRGVDAAEEVLGLAAETARADHRSAQRIRAQFSQQLRRSQFRQSRTSVLDVQVRGNRRHHLQRPQTEFR